MTAATPQPTMSRRAPMAGKEEASRMPTEKLREHFLLTDLFSQGEIRMVYTEWDRMVVGGVVPVESLALPAYRELGTSYFTERREAGVFNIGGAGVVRVDSEVFRVDRLECLYIGLGHDEIRFEACEADPPEFYLLSCPAHTRRPSRLVTRDEAVSIELGDIRSAAKRRIHKFICPERAASDQLSMGYTELEPNSVWNTMPPHTHGRRMEVYLYFDLDDGLVVHLMGPPDQTRHLIVRNKEAVLSPPWSIHCGAGTRNYRFVWGMAGENQDFQDIDRLSLAELQ